MLQDLSLVGGLAMKERFDLLKGERILVFVMGKNIKEIWRGKKVSVVNMFSAVK